MRIVYEQHFITPNWRRLDVGGTPLTIIGDGVATFDDLPTLVGADQPAGDVEKLAEKAFLHPRHLRMGLNVPVLSLGDELIVFDAGIGEMGRRGGTGLLASTLGAAGLSANEVTLVCLTHLHADHIGGLIDGETPLFPNARYVIGRAEYE